RRAPVVEMVAAPEAPPETRIKRQFVNFAFYSVDPAWRRLPDAERTQGKQAFAKECERFEKGGGLLIPYSLVGIRADCEFMMWRIHSELQEMHSHTAALPGTGLGEYLKPAHSLIG